MLLSFTLKKTTKYQSKTTKHVKQKVKIPLKIENLKDCGEFWPQ